MGLKLNNKGVYFTLDAFFSTLLLLIGVILITKFSVTEVSTEQIDLMSKDILLSFGEIKISELNNSWVNEQVNQSYIVNTDNSVLEQIGIFWALNDTERAQNLSMIMVEQLIPDRYGINISIEGETIFSNGNSNDPLNLVSSRRMLTGIQQDSPISGSTATALVRKIRNKRTSAFVYFGGFIGQGNITAMMTDLPLDVEGSDVTEIIMEADLAEDFEFYINGVSCGNYNVTPAVMTAGLWNITSCKSNIQANINNTFRITFDANISSSYISGGYIKVIYNSSDFNEQEDEGTNRNYMSGIDGVINIFDSFYVPGTLDNLSIYLHYDANPVAANNTFYLTVADQVVYRDNTSTGETSIFLDNDNFSTLNYSAMDLNTVPIRIGFENLSFKEVLISSGEGFGDIILTTDVSGSMNWRFDSNSAGTQRICNDSQLYDNSTQRLSVAQCLDKDFVVDIFENTTLNRVGLVSYESSVDSTLDLTNNENDLYNEIESYFPSGGTCISCGAAEAYNLLSNPPKVRLNNDYWQFNLDYQFSDPPADWMDNSFNDSSWSSGEASFGYSAGETTAITSINSSVNFWENDGDDSGIPADFNSGTLNSTTNDFRNLTSQDGWDWIEGNVYDADNTNVNVVGLTDVGSGDYELRLDIGGSSTGSSDYQTSGGSFGILVNVTSEMYTVIQNGGYASFSFRWSWDDRDWFETSDQIWIKASITNTTGDNVYLGSDLDSSHTNGDASLDVYADDDPDGDRWDQLFSTDISSHITGPGLYYIDFGGKLHRNYVNEDGRFYFDDIQLGFLSKVGNTYYRTSFDLSDLSRFSDVRLYVSSDDGAEVFLNGNLISNDSGPHNSTYWNVNSSVSIGSLIVGTNVLAAKLHNNDSTSGLFDLELRANMSDRQKAMVIMSDGDANGCVGSWTTTDSSCNDCGGVPCCPDASGSFSSACPDIAGLSYASEQLVNISCYLYNEEDISIFSVAFGDVSSDGKTTLNLSAACDNESHFYLSNNVSGLADMYRDIAQSIVEGFTTRESQLILTTGSSFSESIIYEDSYVEIDYDPAVLPSQTNEISLVFHESNLPLSDSTNCTTNISVTEGLRVLDSKVTVYSADHWANLVILDNTTVFNLTDYSPQYITLGDPFVIQIPSSLMTVGEHSLLIQTGDDDSNFTGCSANNSLIYKGVVNSSTSRSSVVESNDGCTWEVDFEDGTNATFSIPASYSGNNSCFYTNASISYISTDAYALGVYQLFTQLDFDQDGRVIFNFGQEDLEVIAKIVSDVPYLWGPSIVEVNMWQ